MLPLNIFIFSLGRNANFLGKFAVPQYLARESLSGLQVKIDEKMG
jgi:hypothetical protein